MFWKRYLKRLQSNLLYKRAFRAKEWTVLFPGVFPKTDVQQKKRSFQKVVLQTSNVTSDNSIKLFMNLDKVSVNFWFKIATTKSVWSKLFWKGVAVF